MRAGLARAKGAVLTLYSRALQPSLYSTRYNSSTAFFSLTHCCSRVLFPLVLSYAHASHSLARTLPSAHSPLPAPPHSLPLAWMNFQDLRRKAVSRLPSTLARPNSPLTFVGISRVDSPPRPLALLLPTRTETRRCLSPTLSLRRRTPADPARTSQTFTRLSARGEHPFVPVPVAEVREFDVPPATGE